MRSLLLVLALCTCAQAASLKSGVFEPAHPAPEFRLQGSDGQDLSLARFRGRLVLLVFGFTNCPEVCPTTLATLALARQQLGEAAAKVQVVYVTVDPERDTQARIKSYLAAFDGSFVGGSGDAAALKAVFKQYGVVATKVAGKEGRFGYNHSSSVYLIDGAGKLRALMPYGHGAADYVHDLKRLLAEK